MASSGKIEHRAVTEARLKAPATLFVCNTCDGGRRLRRKLRAAAKDTGRKREVRIVGCTCLDLCPKRGTATVLARAGAQGRCSVIDDRAEPAEVLARLLT